MLPQCQTHQQGRQPHEMTSAMTAPMTGIVKKTMAATTMTTSMEATLTTVPNPKTIAM